MSTHRLRFLPSYQCGICNSMIRMVDFWNWAKTNPNICLCECPHCEVQFKVPIQYLDCEIVPPRNQSDGPQSG